MIDKDNSEAFGKELELRYGVPFFSWISRYRSIISLVGKLDVNYFLSIPYCANQCSFCDLPREGAVPSDEYVENLVWQMKRVAEEYPWSADSYFWLGAGTATVLSDQQFARLASVMGPTCKCIEADLATYKKVFRWCQTTPISNLSIGVQTLDDRIRMQYRLQKTTRCCARDAVEEARDICAKFNVRLNLDFMCFDKNLERTMEEIIPFLGDAMLDLSIYPHVSYFSNPEFDSLKSTEPLFAEIDRVMAKLGYVKLSRNGCYTLLGDQPLRRYFDCDYVIGMGKYGRIVPKNKRVCFSSSMHGVVCSGNELACSQLSEKGA
jgi:hypothetical protein